jgi:hypothetical protein
LKTHSPTSNNTTAASSQPFFNKKGGEASLNNDTSFFQKSNGHPVQAKLNVGKPNDKYEKEADTIADKVVQRKNDPKVQAKPVTASTPVTPFVQTKCAACEKEEMQDREEKKEEGVVQMCSCNKEKEIQRQGQDDEFEPVEPAFEDQLSATQGQGAALSGPVRNDMEGAIGADFSGVRIHTGSQAAQMNRSLNAHAFTHGNNIYFNEGQYDTNSTAGKHLLAHELTHTIQQGAARSQQPAREEALPQVTTPIPATTPAQPGSAVAEPAVAPSTAAQEPVAAQPEAQAVAQPTTPEQAQATPQAEATSAGAEAPLPAQAAAVLPAETDTGGGDAAPVAGEPAEAVGAEPAQGNQAEQLAGNATQEGLLMNRLARAEDSPLKREALMQANFMKQDALMSEMAANRIAFRRSVEYTAYFNGVRENVTGFVLDRIIGVQLSLINSRQFLSMNAEAIKANISVMVTGALTSGLTTSLQYINNISSFVTSTQQNITQTVGGIAGRITGMIQSISLPDLPGIEGIRNSIAAIVNRIAGQINAALDTVVSLITSILQRAMTAIATIVQTLNQVINQLLDMVLAAINRLINMVFGYLERIGTATISTLMRLLNNTIFPILARVERMILQKIELTRRQIIRSIRENYTQTLQGIVDAVSPDPAAPTDTSSQQDQPLTRQEQIAQIATAAYQFATTNATIITDFEQKTASIYAILVQQLLSAIEQVKMQIQVAIARIAVKIAQFILRIMGQLGRILEIVTRAIDRIIQSVMNAFQRLYEAVVRFISNPIQTLQQAASNVWTRIQNFITEITRNILSGTPFDVNSITGGSQTTLAVGYLAPALAPAVPVIIEVIVEVIVIPVIVIGGAMILFVEGGIIIVIGGVAIFIAEEVLIVILIVIAIIILIIIMILIAILLYLLYKLIEAILKPAPIPVPTPVPGPKPIPIPQPIPQPVPKPKPKPKPCAVFPLGYHRGGHPLHNHCADTVPPNIWPGSDAEVIHPLLGRKSFDALDPGDRLWEVKTNRYSTYSPGLRRITIARCIAEMLHEGAIAHGCGHPYVFGVRDPLMYLDLIPVTPPGVILVPITC